MKRYLVRRLLLAVPVLVGVSIVVFMVLHLSPGDPAEIMLGSAATKEDLARLRADLGLTEPLPVPSLLTVKVWNTGSSVNVALAVCAALMVTAHVLAPLQAPLQPVKLEPAAGVAVSVTTVSSKKLAAHVAPQLMPAGLLVIAPLPVPARLTDNVRNTGSSVKVAVTDRAALIVATQAPAPLHAPLHPAKLEPVAGLAVRVTTVSSR